MGKRRELQEDMDFVMEEWKRNFKVCPHCLKVKKLKEFGWRNMKGKVRIQSWCMKCRGGCKKGE